MNKYFNYPYKFQLESGAVLDSLQLAYQVVGNPNASKTIWVCHALTGDTSVLDWWSGLFGTDKLFDPAEYRIVCANAIGSCYGSTGPMNFDYPLTFPILTIRDQAFAIDLLFQHLELTEIDILIGPSLGGQLALEWAIESPNKFKRLILMACNGVHSAFGRGFNEAQRLALHADPSFGKKEGGRLGLKAARAMAMLSYRSYADFAIKRKDLDNRIEDFQAVSYLQYQGEKFVRRFDPYAYYTLTKVMDSHDITRGRGSMELVLQTVQAKTLIIGIDSDLLFPVFEQKELAKYIPQAEFGLLKSEYGHDAFLIEYQQLVVLIDDFLHNGFKKHKPTTFKKIKQHVN